MTKQKLVFLRDIWEALGKPATFKAERGAGAFVGRVLEMRPDTDDKFTPTDPQWEALIAEGNHVVFSKECVEFLNNPQPRWVPPYQQWKSQPTSTATSWQDVVRAGISMLDEKKQKERT